MSPQVLQQFGLGLILGTVGLVLVVLIFIWVFITVVTQILMVRAWRRDRWLASFQAALANRNTLKVVRMMNEANGDPARLRLLQHWVTQAQTPRAAQEEEEEEGVTFAETLLHG